MQSVSSPDVEISPTPKSDWALNSFLFRRPILVFTCILIITFTLLGWQIQRLQTQTISSLTLHNTQTLATSLINTKAQLKKLSISKYKGKEIKIRAFGPYAISSKIPRGLKGEFIRSAWQKLVDSKSRQYYEYDHSSGRTILRYAHTFAPYGHTISAKYEDARFILEITAPIETVFEHNPQGVISTIFLLIICALIMIAFLQVILKKLHAKHALAKKFLRDAEQADALRTEFLSTTSHELRTPLTAISGSLSIVLSDVLGVVPEKPKNILVMANNNCKRLMLLVNDILDVNKMIAGEMAFNMEPHTLQDLIKTAVDNNRGYGETYNIKFHFDPIDENKIVEVDFNRFQQIMSNLMSNAAKFSPVDEDVVITVTSHGSSHRVSVIDKGPGIPEYFRDKVFDRFSQADSSDTKQTGGTGLGMRITKNIVEEFGGTIGFETEEGEGTTFYFDLTAYHAEQSQPQSLAS